MKDLLSSVSPKGQITVPAEIRRMLGLKPKDRVVFRLDRGKVEITPVQSPLQDSFQAIPALVPPRSWKEIEAAVVDEIASDAAREGLE